MEITDSDQIVARFWRWDAERLEIDARNDRKHRLQKGEINPEYSISVFASPPLGPGDDPTAVEQELVGHMLGIRKAKHVAFTTRSRLESSGFAVRLSEPPEGHHDVVLGHSLETHDLVRLESVFNERGRVRVL